MDQAPNWDLSPYTGWTRTHWEQLADEMLLAVRPWATERHGLINLPGPASASGRWSDGLEGFARTFLLAGFRLAQSGEDDPHNIAEWYAEGLVAGTEKRGTERWLNLDERTQPIVECASVALALHESRPYIWDRLAERDRQQVVDWMSRMVGIRTWDNNWVWFQNITEAFLRSVGGPWSSEDLERNFALTDEWYVGDGWYSDGNQSQGGLRNFDYYSGWAMHFYPLWYCRISSADTEPGLLEKYRDRLRAYLTDAQHFVAPNGSPVMQGRSLTYRFAMSVPFWVGEVFEGHPLPPGLTRRLASGVVDHFHSNGLLDNDGLQPIGWHGEFVPIRQSYSGPGSPYWSSKAFAGLVLPPDHPAWTSVEQPLPLESSEIDIQRAIEPAGWVLSATPADGIVRLVNHGSDHAQREVPIADDAFYSRYAYATHAAPDLGEIDVTTPLDSHIALIREDGRASHRRPFDLLHIDAHVVVSQHQAHWPRQFDIDLGPRVVTASLIHGALELRIVRVDPMPDALEGEPIGLRFGGFAVAGDQADTAIDLSEAKVMTDFGLTSLVRLPHDIAITGVTTHESVNPLGRVSRTPWARVDQPVVPGRIYAALVVLSGADIPTNVDVRVDSDRVEATWPDGSRNHVTLPR